MPTVLFYTYEYTPVCSMGPSNTLRLLSSSLIEKGFDIKVVTMKHGRHSSLSREEFSNKTSVYRIQVPFGERLLFAVKAGFFSKLNKDKVSSDLIHVMDSRAAAFIKKGKTPMVVNISDYVASMVSFNPFRKYPWYATDKTKRYFYENFTKLFEFLSFRNANFVIANSMFSNKAVSSYYKIPSEKITTIYKGIDTSEFKGNSRKKDIDVLFVGGNIEKKGIIELIKSVALIKKDFPDLKVVAVGKCSGNYMLGLKGMVNSLGVDKNIAFIYNLPHDELIGYYKRSKIFAMPTYREALGQTILEAMAARLPVVSTEVGGVPEIVTEKNGFLIPPYDAMQLAEKISYLLSNPSKAGSMGLEGFKLVSKKFNLDRMVKSYTSIYDKFI